MKFLVDAQLPPTLAGWLRSRGHEATHVLDRVGVDATDSAIWNAARQDRSVIVTKDRDFAVWAMAGRGGPQVVWVRLGNATSRNLLRWLEPRWDEIEARLSDAVPLVEAGRPATDDR